MSKKKLLVIYYHEIVENGQGYSYQKLDKEMFEQQMRYLKEQGYQTLFFRDLDKPLPEKAIIVSFDDGFRSVYENAIPIMKRYGIKANIYLPTRYIGQDKHFMTWDMVRELQMSGDCEFAAHTHNHVDIRTLDCNELYRENALSTEAFEKELQVRPEAFCMPYGVYDKKSIKLLKESSSYKYILGSFYGDIPQKYLESKVIPRVGISNDDSLEQFEKKLLGKLNWKGPLQRARLFIKSIMGDRVTQYEY